MVSDQSNIAKQPLFQILSLDVILGSIAVGIFATAVLKVQPNPWWWIILPVSVWVVYTLDHLLDGFKKKGESTIYRHRFHYKYRNILGILVVLFGLSAVILSVVFLEREIVFRGLVLSVFVSIYFGMVYLLDKFRFNHFLKELIIAFVYIAGIFLAPLFWNGGLPSYPTLIVILILFLLAWIESVIISYFDFENDLADGFKSFTVAFSKNASRKMIITILLLVAVFLMLFIFQSSDQRLKAAMIIELIMSSILLLLILFPEKFKNNNRFRWIGESAFYLPAVLYFVSIYS